METFTKKLSNILRVLMWYGDYALFKTTQLFTGVKSLPENIQNILIIELLYIGDVIAITPTIRALKQKFPKANIDVLLRPSMNDVLTGNPNVNMVLTYDKQDFETRYDIMINELKGRYDIAVLLHPGVDIGNYRVSKLLRDAGIPFRIGCTKVGFMEGKGFFMHKKTKPTFELKHKVEDNLDVVRTIGIDTTDKYLGVYTTKEAELYVNELLKKEGVAEKDFLVIIHAAPQHQTHEWVAERFANIADELIRKYDAKIVFTGSQKDEDYNQKVIGLMKEKSLNFAGKTDIKQFFSAIKRANLVISVDTAAMHVAAALDKPVIALFGAGNPKIWAPYCKKAKVIFKEKESCTSCMKHKCKKNYKCMRAIMETDVLEGVKELLNDN